MRTVIEAGRSAGYFYNMSVILLLLLASLSVAGLFLGAFIWGMKTRQFDDDFAPPMRILFDDVIPTTPEDAASPKSTAPKTTHTNTTK